MNGQPSPFEQTRFEFTGTNLFYLSSARLAQLREPTPLRVIGHRGTGKTTLLRSLSWRERIKNRRLGEALGGDPFSDRVLGLYTRIPRSKLQSLHRSLSSSPDDFYLGVTVTYLELIWIEQCARGVAEVAQVMGLNIPIESEQRVADEVLAHLRSLDQSIAPAHGSLAAVESVSGFLRGLLERQASSNRSWDELSRWSAPVLLETATRATELMCSLLGSDEWHVKACVDEGEWLSDRQDMVVNTMMRASQWPLIPVVAYLARPQVGDRTLGPTALGHHDRDELVLDVTTDAEFAELCLGITRLRCEKLGIEPDRVDLDRILGELWINKLIHEPLQASLSEEAVNIKQKAMELAVSYPWAAGDRGDEIPPYYQAYLVDRLRLDLSESEGTREQRVQSASELRQKMVAAHLGICHELNLELRFSSKQMLLQMADTAVRDFLWQMDEVYKAVGKPLGDFLEGPAPIKAQTAGIKEASRNKMKDAESYLAEEPKLSAHLVSALGQLTARLQSSDSRGRNLKSYERGRFKMRLWRDDPKSRRLAAIIRDAHEQGYLRIISQTSSQIEFRVSASLAANYGFSYRGAQSPTSIDQAMLLQLSMAKDEDALDRAVDAVWSQLQKGEDQPSLFDEMQL